MSSLSRFVIGISKTFTKNPSIIGQKSCTGFDELGTKCNFNFKLLHQKREKKSLSYNNYIENIEICIFKG